MKRRDFLKFIGLAPLAPSVLATIPALPKPPEKLVGNSIDWFWFDEEPDCIAWTESDNLIQFDADNYTYVRFVCSQPNTHS